MRRAPGPFFAVAAVLLVVAVTAPMIAVLTAMPPSEAISRINDTARDALRVSLVASASATLVATLCGVPAGYYLAGCPARVRGGALFLLALPLAFPPVASGLMLLYALGTNSAAGGWLASHGLAVPDSLPGVAVSEFFVSGSFVAIAATAAFAAIDPIYTDAARTLGASESKIFARVALPAASSSIGAGVAFAWLRAIGEYGATSIVAYHPTSLPVALYVALSASGVRAALALCYAFVVLAALVLAGAWTLRRGVARV